MPIQAKVCEACGRNVCVSANLNVEQYIDDIYTLQHTLCIWENEFPVLLDVSNWEVSPPVFELQPDLGLHRVPKGRAHVIRIHDDVDVNETVKPKRCKLCSTTGNTWPHCTYRVN
ncbi:hypothetical protein GOBAR_AA04310 [Gossypium barbadense]|uniref:Uncharacterized protein n=1 Tax=Gossypium barbadense TaxID=3634 RepID=A0A2P5YKZ4_GOSBA|nr:hypothetical protein GOBAR_AA04310 [Gossypium barbadense]